MAVRMMDETLDQTRARLAAELPNHAAFDGWSAAAVDAAAEALGVNRDVAQLAFGGSEVAMIDAWFATVDSAMLAAFPADSLSTMKVRARITALLETRLTLLTPHKEALRRALSILAIPTNLLTATKLGWRAADVMWRAAGDTATDYNHYTKRAILGGVYGATLAVFMNDDSDDHAETLDFLGRRIEGIMQFEKAKAGFISRQDMHFSPARFLGRLRYPA
jgi:ubiquinone biosynthesis protein COQ9